MRPDFGDLVGTERRGSNIAIGGGECAVYRLTVADPLRKGCVPVQIRGVDSRMLAESAIVDSLVQNRGGSTSVSVSPTTRLPWPLATFFGYCGGVFEPEGPGDHRQSGGAWFSPGIGSTIRIRTEWTLSDTAGLLSFGTKDLCRLRQIIAQKNCKEITETPDFQWFSRVGPSETLQYGALGAGDRLTFSGGE